ncbi:ester cyclase [Mycolicibacterium sp.]|uniref:ester cyclase n=1 Tax=Mycolicibacterium sp. TaxID=2320850 RepID=UPI003D12CA98
MQDLERTYRGYIHMINERRFEQSHRFASPEMTFSGTAMSREDYFGGIQQALEAVPDFQWQIDRLVVDGDWVASRVVGTGTPVRPWMGLQPNGRSVTFVEHAFYHCPGGKITTVEFVRDVDAIRAQLTA